jgi:phage terminase large subunit
MVSFSIFKELVKKIKVVEQVKIVIKTPIFIKKGTGVSQISEGLFRGSAKRKSLGNIVLVVHGINTLKKIPA